ncbi:MAG: hypothetical protein WC330_01435 [Candidatus Omnitrophota bacterium]|jgi:hypothetical protein
MNQKYKTKRLGLTRLTKIVFGGPLCILLLLGISGCATVAVDPGVGFIPNEQEGIVFGQMQLLSDGNLIRYDDTKYFFGVLPQKIVTHVSPYSDGQALNMNLLIPGKLAFATQIADEGYFSAKLPVGRYYIEEFGYYLKPGTPFPGGVRTYMRSYDGTEPSNPSIIIFNVLPDKATYIGTFIHRADFVGERKLGAEIKMFFKMQIINEYDKCKSVFLAKHSMTEGSVVSEIATFIPFGNQIENQKQQVKATKAALDEFNSVANAAGITADNITADLGRTGDKTTDSASSLTEEKIREVLRGYKVGVATYKQCMDDAKAGSWKMNLGGMGMEPLSRKVALNITVGIGERDICDLVFEGDDPQQTGTGKTPNFDKFLLKEITFKP